MPACVQVGVDQNGQHHLAFVVDQPAVGGDEGPSLVVEHDVGDDNVAGEHVAGPHRTAEPQIPDATAGDGRPVPARRLDRQPLQDGQGVESAGYQTAERAALRPLLVDMKPLGIPPGGEADEFRLGYRVRAQAEALTDEQVFRVHQVPRMTDKGHVVVCHRGAIRTAPSRRIVSPLSMGLVTIASTK